jgi:hypothetical protein
MSRFQFSLKFFFCAIAAAAIAVGFATSKYVYIYSDEGETAFTVIDSLRYEKFGIGHNQRDGWFVRMP